MPTEIASFSPPVAVPRTADATVSVRVLVAGGKALPQGGKAVPVQVSTADRKQPPQELPPPDAKSLVVALNKFLNNSGRPNQFRVDPAATTQIQEINPANGAVVGQFAISEFRALAQSIGAVSLLVDSHA